MSVRATLVPYPKWLSRFTAQATQWPDAINIAGILWQDAIMTDSDDHRPVMAFTVGVVIEACKEYLTIAHEVFEDRDERHKTSVPAGMIRGVLSLGSAALPK